LKLQIDDALGAEDLLVQLTERNLELGEVGISSQLLAYVFTHYISTRKLRRCESP
jgi:hypothetical protein